jgi:hypothetical protein
MTQETRQGRFFEYQRLARLVSQELSNPLLGETCRKETLALARCPPSLQIDSANRKGSVDRPATGAD